MTRTIALLVLLLTYASVHAQSCSTSQIAVDKIQGRMDGDRLRFVGRVTNNCSVPTGPQLKVTVYNKQGDILTVYDFWPASINNIAPGQAYPFEASATRASGLHKFEIMVISTKSWAQR